MGAIGSKLRALEYDMVAFRCPGCNARHAISVKRWTWNGSGDRPTFTPSILVRTGRAVDPNFTREQGDLPGVCHSYVTDGMIRFLSDSTHELAGQTVELPSINEGNSDG